MRSLIIKKIRKFLILRSKLSPSLNALIEWRGANKPPWNLISKFSAKVLRTKLRWKEFVVNLNVVKIGTASAVMSVRRDMITRVRT